MNAKKKNYYVKRPRRRGQLPRAVSILYRGEILRTQVVDNRRNLWQAITLWKKLYGRNYCRVEYKFLF